MSAPTSTRRPQADRRRTARAHERQHLPLRRLFQHRRGDQPKSPGGRHEVLHLRARDDSPAEAAAAARAAGRQVHRRRHQPARPDEARDRDADASDRRQRPRRSTRSSRRPRAACASARWCATPISPPMRACGATMRAARRALLAGASGQLRNKATTARQPAAAHALPLFLRHQPALQQTPARQRLRGDRRRSAGSMRVIGVSDACIATHPERHGRWRCARSTPRWRRCSRDGATRTHPDRRVPSAARRHAAYRDRAGAAAS